MTVKSLLIAVAGTLNLIVVFLLALAVATFVWGLARRFWSSGDPKKVRDSYFYLIVGVVAFAVISAIWAILVLLASLVGVKISGIPQFTNKAPTEHTGSDPCFMYNVHTQAYIDCVEAHK